MHYSNQSFPRAWHDKLVCSVRLRVLRGANVGDIACGWDKGVERTIQDVHETIELCQLRIQLCSGAFKLGDTCMQGVA